MKEKYERIGYRSYEDDDRGIFWSNDLRTPVREMAQALGFTEEEEQLAKVLGFYRSARVHGY